MRKKAHLMPYPIITPAVKKKAPRLWTVNELKIWLPPMHDTPMSPILLTPISLTSFEFMMARAEIIDALSPPMNDSTAGEDKPTSTSAVCVTPHAYVQPTDHQVNVAQEATMTQPYPPSGTVDSTTREFVKVAASCEERSSWSWLVRAEEGGADERSSISTVVVLVAMLSSTRLEAQWRMPNTRDWESRSAVRLGGFILGPAVRCMRFHGGAKAIPDLPRSWKYLTQGLCTCRNALPLELLSAI